MNNRPLTDRERDAVLDRYPGAEVDDAIAWSDWSLQAEIQDEGWDVEADTGVEVEVGLRTLHVFFLQGRISGVAEV
jgi:hypothetical protein